jgi:hypothetical protein
MVGCLMFAMVGTRPDISYAIGIVSKYSQSPKRIHCTVVRRIMRYLKGTATYQLYFSSTDGVNKLFAYSDANMLWILTTENPVVGVMFYLTMAPLHG